MSRALKMILLVILVVSAGFAAWSARYRYDHIIVEGETYVVRIQRVTGHADILVPGEGWVRSEDAWSGPDETPESGT